MSDENKSDDTLRELIEEALKIKVDEKREFRDHEEIAETLGPVMSEFLDSFIVVGYDFDGDPISFQGSGSPQQKDALDTLFLRYFYQRTGYKLIDGNNDELL